MRSRWRLRLGVIMGLVGTIAVLRVGRGLFWGAGRVPEGPLATVFSYGSLLWALPALPCALGVVGMLLYRAPSVRGGRARPCGIHVCFRIVSRGQNAAALAGTVESVRREMASNPLFPYRIEVVTDETVWLDGGDDLRALVVPPSYRTPGDARFKARALQYAIDQSDLSDDAWLFHLDEESHLSPSVVAGICDAVVEEERSGAHRIGQGLILYHRDLSSHPFLTLADMVRTGDDLGRFHLQHRLGVTVFGLHGSFILVRNSVEKRVGFDVGPEGSITEDAFWALREMADGARCRWVDGHVVEQSPRSVADFVKQRRRWLAGMIRVVLYAEVQAAIRVPLAVFTAMWSISWLAMVYTLLNLLFGLRTAPPVAAMGDFCLAAYAVTYLVGLAVNLADLPGLSRLRRSALYVAQVLLLPTFGLLEALAVVCCLLRPERGFHVVAK